MLGSTSETRSAGSSPKRTAVRVADGADERHQPPVAAELKRDRAGRCAKQRHQRARRQERDRDGQHGAGGGDEQALDQQLRHETAARGADRRAHGDFPLAGAGAREHERGEIAARHQQDEAGEPEQQRQRRGVRVAQPADAAPRRNDAEPQAAVTVDQRRS